MERTDEKHDESRGNDIDTWEHENRGKVGESGFLLHVVISFLFQLWKWWSLK